MNLSGLFPLLDQLPAFQKLMVENAALGPSDALLEPQSVIHAAHPYLIAGIATQTEPKPSAVVVVTARSEVAYQLAKQLTSWVQPVEDGGPPIYHLRRGCNLWRMAGRRSIILPSRMRCR